MKGIHPCDGWEIHAGVKAAICCAHEDEQSVSCFCQRCCAEDACTCPNNCACHGPEEMGA